MTKIFCDIADINTIKKYSKKIDIYGELNCPFQGFFGKFAKIDKKKWSSNKCGFRMFVEINQLSDLLETSLTGVKSKNSSAKMKPPKNNYGYGY